MIKPNELRIGNYLLDDLDRVCQIEGIRTKAGKIDNSYIWVSNVTYEYDDVSFVRNFKPIPISDEWLLKLGELRASFSHQPEFYLEWHNDSKTWTCYKTSYEDQVVLTSVQYVHQLQNLFFAITGEELTIKP